VRGLLERFEPALVRVGGGAVVVALFAAVVAGAPLPAFVRIAVAVIATTFWPGAMLLRFFLVDREVELPGRVALSFVLGLGLACALAWAAHGFRFDPGVGLVVLPLLGLVLACVRPSLPEERPEPRGLLPWALLVLWITMITVLVGSLGAPLMTDTDSPDHIATVRRIADTRQVFPTDVFFVDAGIHGADPRKGLYHAWVAMIVRGAHVDPVRAWQALPALLIPVFLFAVAAFTFALTRSRMGALVSAVLFPLIYGGGLGGTELRETVYSTRVGEIAALLAAAALVRHVEGGGVRRLALWVALGWTAIAVHLWYALYFALAFGVYGLGTLLVRRDRVLARRLGLGAAALAVLALPYLLFRAAQSYGPQNEIHTEPQGLFLLGERLFTVDPQAVWGWTGASLLVALLAAPWFWRRRHESTGAIYLALVPWAVVGIVLNPFLLPLVHGKLGYLTMRLIWIVPVVPILATVVTALGEKALRGPGPARARAWAWGGLAAFTLWLLPQIGQAVSVVTERPRLLAQERERGVGPWADVLEFLRQDDPARRVFVSDPATSYSIPAWTGRHVVAILDQHGSPNDPRGLERILVSRDILSPFVDARRTLELLRAWQADAVVVNQRFVEPISFDYWSVSPVLYGPTRAKFDGHPEWFDPIYATPGATVYALTPAAKSGPLPPGEDPSAVRRWNELPFHAGSENVFEPAPYGNVSIPGLRLHRAAVDRDRYDPGDTVRVTTWWSYDQAGPLKPGSYTIFVRLDGHGFEGPLYRTEWGKPYRKLVERVRGQRWRLRESHRVLNGVWSPDQWRRFEVAVDSTALVLPADMAPGPYDVTVQMVRQPHYPNTRLSDYLTDDDQYSGPTVGRLWIGERAQ
jgi:hypothetical protein